MAGASRQGKDLGIAFLNVSIFFKNLACTGVYLHMCLCTLACLVPGSQKRVTGMELYIENNER